MPIFQNDSAPAETQKSSEMILKQGQEKQSQQGLSRQCWSQIGAAQSTESAQSKSVAASLGLPDLSLFDGSGSDTPSHRQNSMQNQLKTDVQQLKVDVASLKQDGNANPEMVHQLKEVEKELKHAEKNHNPEELKKATEELAALTKALSGKGGSGGDGGSGGGGGGGGNSGGGGNGTGGDGGSGGGGNGTGGDGGSGGGGGGTGGDSGSGGVGSTATTFGTDAMPAVDQTKTPGFYVSSSGSANGDGTAAHPFATLEQAQKAMQNSSIKTTYVEGGTYKMSSTLNLTSADSGESFVSVGGSTNPAVLDGGGKLSDLVSLNGANNVSIEGFSMQNTSNSPVWSSKHGQVNSNVGAIFAQNSSGDTIAYNSMNNVNVGVNMQGDSNMNISQNSITNAQSAIDSGSSGSTYGSNNTIQGNLVDNITGYGAKLFDNVGAINIYGDTNATINNNVIENTAGVGIQMNYEKAGSGFTVANNTITNTDYLATTAKPDTGSNPVGDDGAIHIYAGKGNSKMLNGTVSNNNISGAGPNHADKCIYLDDGVNGVTVSGNVLQEGGPGYAMQIHGGSNNVVDNNTFLLGSTGGGLLYQTDGYQMTGNVIENNNFNATGNGQKAYSFLNTSSSDMPTFLDDIYSPGLHESPDPNGSTG